MISNLPLRYKILLPSAAVLILTVILSVFLFQHLIDIRQQNEIVRDWAGAIEQLQTAISSGQSLDNVASQMETASNGKERDDAYFSYQDQYGLLSQSIQSPVLLSKLSADNTQFLFSHLSLLEARVAPDPRVVHASVGKLLPVLNHIFSGLLNGKRAAYMHYYDSVNLRTTNLMVSLFAVISISITFVVALSFWISRSVISRIRNISSQCQMDCGGGLATSVEKIKGDEMDALAACVSRMISRMLNVVNTDKLLEGVEDERRRIAMDLHDHILADLTNLSRDLRSLQMRKNKFSDEALESFAILDHGLAEISQSIRCVMDDLHPQTLDMLGVGAALRSYLEKKLTREELPSYRLYVDDAVDTVLTSFQRLTVYRIGLEAINNVVRHAQCSRYEIDCHISGDMVVLSVEDNGRGFNSENILLRQNGRGIANIEQRAMSMAGKIVWSHSRFSSGTRVELRFPLALSQAEIDQLESAAA